MKLNSGLASIVLVFVFSVYLTQGCVKKVSNVIMKTTTTPSPTVPSTRPPPLTEAPQTIEPAELVQEETAYSKNANLKGPGFFIEIEESLDNTTKIHELKELPPIYSQIINNETHTPSVPPHLENATKIVPTEESEVMSEAPPNQSLTSESDMGIGSSSVTTIDDEAVRQDWQGTCSSANWNYCNQLKQITLMNVFTYIDGKDVKYQHLDLDCIREPVVCLHNGWTANRCHILCMSKCNREILLGWDIFVSYEGQCKYI